MKRLHICVICILLVIVSGITCHAEVPYEAIQSLSFADLKNLSNLVGVALIKKDNGSTTSCYSKLLDLELMDMSIDELKEMQATIAQLSDREPYLDALLQLWEENGTTGLNMAYYVALSTHREGGDYTLIFDGTEWHFTFNEMQIIRQWLDGKYSPAKKNHSNKPSSSSEDDKELQNDSDAIIQSNDDITMGDNNSDNTLETILERQDRFMSHYKYTAERRLREYWEVTISDFTLSCEEDSEAVKIITIHMKWDVQNGEDQTRKMLTMYSDDMAAYLKESDPDTPINRICIIWEVPYILKNGPVAKYEYYDAGTYMMHSKSSGYLYPDSN